jgi:hypothetical protein
LLTLTKTLRRLNNQSAGLLRSEAALWLERFALSRVVRHEEVLNLVDEVLIQVVERLPEFTSTYPFISCALIALILSRSII